MGGAWPTLTDVLLTTLRWAFGVSLGCVGGLALACIERRIGVIGVITRPLGNFLRAVPVIALVPIVLVGLGAAEKGKILLIAWAVVFPVWIAVRQALATRLVDVEVLLAAAQRNTTEILWVYTLPRAALGTVRGLEISLGIGWIVTVAAEWLGTYSKGFWAGGLGYRLLNAQNANDWAAMFVIIFVFGILGWISSAAFSHALKRVSGVIRGFDPLAGLTQN